MKFNLPNVKALRKLSQQAEEKKQQYEGGDIRFEKFDDPGHYKFIVCPPYNSNGLFVRQLFTHWNLGEKGETRIACPEYNPNLEEKRPCPICAVLKVLKEQMDEEERKKLSRFYARGATYVNVRMHTLADKEVFKDSDFLLPRILRGPSKLADHINYYMFQLIQHRQEEDFDFESYAYNDEIIFDVKKIQAGKGKDNVKYEYQVSPFRGKLAKDRDELKEIVENMYDLDVILSKQIKWDRSDYDSSVALANSLLSYFNYDELSSDEWDDIAAFEELEKPKGASREESKEEKPKKHLNVGSQSKKAVSKKKEEDEEEDNTEEDHTQASDQEEDKKPVAKAKASAEPVRKKHVEVDSEEIVRDPENLGDDGNPVCFGHQSNDASECRDCRFLHMCIQDRFKRRIEAQKASKGKK